MQPNRLINRQQFMKPILPEWANAQSKVNLRKRSDGYGHGGI